jgi:cytochrome c553
MPGVAYRLTADDIVAVAHYLARLPATP